MRKEIRIDGDYVAVVYPSYFYVSKDKIMMKAEDLIANKGLKDKIKSLHDAMELLECYGVYTFARY